MPLSSPSASAHWQVVTRLDRFKTLRPLLEARSRAWPTGSGRSRTAAARLRLDHAAATGDARAMAAVGARRAADVATFC